MRNEFIEGWRDYQLLDSGNFLKIERFGNYILIRPEQQAIWNLSVSIDVWRGKADAEFVYTNKKTGIWKKYKNIPDTWTISWKTDVGTTKFKLRLTAFKHVGIFPEQQANWKYIQDVCSKMNKPKVLNLFAYTGGASMAAAVAGAEVTHVDSIKQVIGWTRENMQLSEIESIRSICEDAFKFVQREIKRGNKYNGIILDPPSFGLGPKGEKWILQEKINELVKSTLELLDREHFYILNTYSMGFSSINMSNVIQSYRKVRAYEGGELVLKSKEGNYLPLSFYGRFSKI